MDFNFPAQVKSKSIEELQAIYCDGHLYQPEMVSAAMAELNARGVDMADLILQKGIFDDEQETMFAQGKSGSALYILISFVFAVMGGVIGIVAGYIYGYSKTTSFTGNRYYVYDKQTREFGMIIFWLGVIVLVCSVIYYMQGKFGF